MFCNTMPMKTQNIYPDWAEKYREPGKTIRKVGSGYALVRCTSTYVQGANPKSSQEYLGRITEKDGFIPKVPRASKTDSHKDGEDRDTERLEYGLSRFLKKNFGRGVQRGLYAAPADLVSLVIITYIFGSCSRENLLKSSLTADHAEELDDYRGKISEKRIAAGVKKLTQLIDDALPDASLRRNIESSLLMITISLTGKAKPKIPEELQTLITNDGLKI